MRNGAGKVSTIDLFGRSFVLLAGFEGGAWCAAGKAAADRFPGLELKTYHVNTPQLLDPDLAFAESYGLRGSGAALVRPDGFVAWRAKAMEPDPAQALAGALSTVLARH
jgi:hypothetical protein